MKKFFSFLLILMGLSIVFTACKDDEIALMSLDEGRGSELDGETTTPGALQRDEDGLWKATERVPLVGAGRVVDKISPALVAVAASQSGFNKIVDAENLNDYATLSGLSANLLGKEILSVRDIYRTYAGGQMVGFVIGNNEGGVLDLNLINLFVITLYNDGEPVGTYNVSTGGELLSLNLISIGNAGTQAMAVKVPDDVNFDEIMLSTTGVTADIEKMKIYYAFVGETDIEEVTTATYTESKVHDSDIPSISIPNTNKAVNLLNLDNEDGCYLDYGTVFYKSKHYVDIDLGKTLPVGTEVGFTYEQGSVAGLTLGHTYSVTTYGSDGSEKDDFSSTNVLGVSVIGGGKGAYSLVATKEGTQRVRITSGPTVGLDVGAFRLLRAFTRKAVAIDPTSYFNIPEKITTPYTSYKFAKPEKGTLILSYTGSSTDDVTISDNVISGMTLGNTYSLNVTYDVDGKSFVTPVQIECTENTSDNCNPIYLKKTDGWSVVNANDTWGINVISVMTDTENIVDGNNTTYASSATAINLLQHGVLAAVKGQTAINPAGTYRVGFIIQNASELLGASALKFFTIKLFNGNNEIDSNVSLSNQGVSLGLLNGARDKMAITIETDQEFDGVALCTAGLLGVSLNNLRIYDAFYYEDAKCGNSMAFDACSEMMNSVNCHLSINYDWTEITGVASVGASINDLANAVDVDATNYATITAPVGVASGFSIGFQFDEMKSGQWIGLKMRKPTGLTDVELLNGFKFEIMYQGQVVEEIKNESSGGVLGLNLLGYGEYVYLEATPKYNFDGIRISSGQLVGALRNYLIYGLYSMADADGNGIPDCSEDGEGGTTDVLYPDKCKYDICKSEPLVMDFTGGTAGKKYTFTFTFTEQSDNREFGKVDITMPANRRVTIVTDGSNGFKLPVGEYYLNITSDLTDGETNYPNKIRVIVHPKTSAWKKEPNSTDWNDSKNWTEGVPWTCTDVLIPSDCNYYPKLESGKKYYCNRIQFEPGAEVINTHYLNYEQAWVDVSLKSGEYNMFSAPLKETYTGDMFISNVKSNGITGYEYCWLDYTESTYPANRFEPKVYQRLWNASVQNAQNTDGGYVAVNPEDNFWTAPFNLVSQEYEAGQGVLVRPDTKGTTGSSYTFRFPKRHTKYEYYNYAETGAGSQTGRWETISRNSADVGRFIYEDDLRRVSFPYHVTLENKRPTTMFLAGNPFMAHINVKTFLEANPAVKAIKVVVKNGDKYTYNTGLTQIAPTQAFLVEVKEAYQSTYRYKLNIHFTEDMLEQGIKMNN